MHELSVLKTLDVQVIVIKEHEVTWVDLYKYYLLHENFLEDKTRLKRYEIAHSIIQSSMTNCLESQP